MSKSQKGSAFERTISEQLSLWWSKNTRDDIFWRTSQSGGRATQRAKQGKLTFGQYGDIQAIDPCGQPLLDLLTIELKRGYSGVSPMEWVENVQPGKFTKWVQQSIRQSELAKTKYWLLIIKHDCKLPYVVFPMDLWDEMVARNHWLLSAKIAGGGIAHEDCEVTFLSLKDFLANVQKEMIESILYDWKHGI